MSLQHNELSNDMVAYLKNYGYKKVKQEDHYVDITCENAVGEKIFFEIKTAQTVRSAIREALGQLLEYNHYPNEKKADKLIIVTKLEPEKADVQYLNYLRETYKIPVYYQYFDMNQKVLDYSLVIAPVVADLCTTPVALSAPPNSYQNNSQS